MRGICTPATAILALTQKTTATVPRLPGSSTSKGGRLATAPLRRYIDCMSQRQILSVLCGQGTALTSAECREVSERCGKVRNSIVASANAGRGSNNDARSLTQKQELQLLTKAIQTKNKLARGKSSAMVVNAIATGRKSEVVIKGTSIRCLVENKDGRQGERGYAAGTELRVRIVSIDPSKNFIRLESV